MLQQFRFRYGQYRIKDHLTTYILLQERLKSLQSLIHEVDAERRRNESTVGLIKAHERLSEESRPSVSQVRVYAK